MNNEKSIVKWFVFRFETTGDYPGENSSKILIAPVRISQKPD